MSELSFQVPSSPFVLRSRDQQAYCCGVELSLRRRGIPRGSHGDHSDTASGLLSLLWYYWYHAQSGPPPSLKTTPRKHIALLLDQSESMSVLEGNTSRYQQAVDFARETLLPMVDQSELQVHPFLFADSTQAVDGATLASATATGQTTNLGQAIIQSIVTADTSSACRCRTDRRDPQQDTGSQSCDLGRSQPTGAAHQRWIW